MDNRTSKILWKASDWSTFLTVCLFKCVLKLFEPEDAKLHCFTFLQCAFSYGSSNCLREKTQNHTSCICLTFVHCVFSHGSSKNLDQCRHNHTGCICWTFHHCAFSYVSSNGLREKMRNHTGCICLTFSHCVFSNVLPKRLPMRMHNRTGSICLTFLHFVVLDYSSNGQMEIYSLWQWYSFHSMLFTSQIVKSVLSGNPYHTHW